MAKNGKILTPTRMGNFLMTSMDWEFYTMEMKLDTDVLEETFAL